MLNNINLIGRVTKDIEVQKTKNNKSVINFTLAVSKGKDENERTQFINCVAWEGKAEAIAKYVKKGDMFGVSGELINHNTEYNGVKQYSFLVNVDDFTFLPNTRKEQSNNATKEQNSSFKRSEIDANSEFVQQQSLTGDGRDIQGFILDDEDLPF